MLPASTVARKLLIAVTGQAMILFVLFHIAGNSTIYFGKLNAYAAGLHAFPLLVWLARIVLGVGILLHIIYGIWLTFENSGARPAPYAVANERAATFASKNMIWTGTLLGSFIVFHLLQFTVQVIHPSISAARNADALGRPDVFMMVVKNFQNIGISVLYLLGVSALWLHLSHGIQSSFQTLGLNSERSFPAVKSGGKAAAIILLLSYAGIPAVIAAGMLK